jgi:hypothetical protein
MKDEKRPCDLLHDHNNDGSFKAQCTQHDFSNQHLQITDCFDG